MKICLIGGAGYIGSCLSLSLSGHGHDVTIIDPAEPILFPPEIRHIKNKFDPQQIDLNKFDCVYHLAAFPSIEGCERLGAKKTFQENVEVTKTIVDALKNYSTKLIFASSSAIYATPSLYSVSKLQSEYLVANRPNSISLRLGTVYGISPNMRNGVLVNDMVKQAVNSGHLEIWHPDSIRPYIDIDDCVRYMRLIKTQKFGISYANVASQMVEKIAIAGYISHETLCDVSVVDYSRRFIQWFDMECSIKPFSPISEGIQKLVRHYVES